MSPTCYKISTQNIPTNLILRVYNILAYFGVTELLSSTLSKIYRAPKHIHRKYRDFIDLAFKGIFCSRKGEMLLNVLRYERRPGVGTIFDVFLIRLSQ